MAATTQLGELNQEIMPLAPIYYRAKSILAALEGQTQQQVISRAGDPKLTTDEFRMYSFKIDACPHVGEVHNIEECPYLHPGGEKARRRDPRLFHYQALPCPDFRKSQCKRGDACCYGHGVFECWLHPSKYRTTLCKEGTACTRSVCFFAHTLEQLRDPTPPAALSSALPSQPKQSQQQPQQHLQLPRITTTRVSALKALSSSYENNHPDSPGSILHQQSSRSSNGNISCGFSFSGVHTTATAALSCSSTDTSRCGSPGATTVAAALESLRQASLSLPSSADSSLATTPLVSEMNTAAAGDLLGFNLPASLEMENDLNKSITRDVAMAAAAALRAQQQQAAAAAAAAQAALSRILLLSVPERATAPSSAPLPLPAPQYPSTAAPVVENEEQNDNELALQQLIAGLGL